MIELSASVTGTATREAARYIISTIGPKDAQSTVVPQIEKIAWDCAEVRIEELEVVSLFCRGSTTTLGMTERVVIIALRAIASTINVLNPSQLSYSSSIHPIGSAPMCM